MNLTTVTDLEPTSSTDVKTPRPDAASVYDLHVLVCRVTEGETRARSANLPLPEHRAATVREALQAVIEDARAMIGQCLSQDRPIPWLDSPQAAEENESRFVVPLTL
jgi:hypothetical protein